MGHTSSESSRPLRSDGERLARERLAHEPQNSGHTRVSIQPLTPAPTLPLRRSQARRVEPFTDEWVEWLGTALAGNSVDKTADVTVEHRVIGGGDGGSEFQWHVRLAAGQVEVRRGPAPEGAANLLTFTSDYETACGIELGEKPVQSAFLEGRLRLKGDIRLLLKNRAALRALRVRDFNEH